ncbi:MAG: hypothetical protein ISQ34_05855 [Rickettsiales bacterium]|nr:hypothetical protein [Rickettsiales bacterium]
MKILSKIAVLLSLVTLFSCSKESSTTSQNLEHEISQDFVQGSEDIPLLISMDKIQDEGLGFDSPSGSIMTSSYQSTLTQSKITKFYKKTLPQMGWTVVSSDSNTLKFTRENEELEINFSNQDHKTVIRFLISYDL